MTGVNREELAVAESKPEKFDEIEVKRINVVDEDGTLRLAISNKSRLPQATMDGQPLGERQGDFSSAASTIFFNDEGDECGGIGWLSKKTEKGYVAGTMMAFDQYKSDQVLMLGHEEDNGRRATYLQIDERPDAPLTEVVENLNAIRAMDDGEEKNQRFAQHQETYGARQRVWIGRGAEGEAGVVIRDSKGRPRISVLVDANDVPRIDFLGADGQVVYSLPPKE